MEDECPKQLQCQSNITHKCSGAEYAVPESDKPKEEKEHNCQASSTDEPDEVQTDMKEDMPLWSEERLKNTGIPRRSGVESFKRVESETICMKGTEDQIISDNRSDVTAGINDSETFAPQSSNPHEYEQINDIDSLLCHDVINPIPPFWHDDTKGELSHVVTDKLHQPSKDANTAMLTRATPSVCDEGTDPAKSCLSPPVEMVPRKPSCSPSISSVSATSSIDSLEVTTEMRSKQIDDSSESEDSFCDECVARLDGAGRHDSHQDISSEQSNNVEENCTMAHDIHVDIIHGPVTSQSSQVDVAGDGSRDGGASPGLPDSSSETAGPGDDWDGDEELMIEMDVQQASDGGVEVPPLYEVGPSAVAECEVCLESRRVSLRLCCGTPICDGCMSAYIESAIRDGKVKIECPGRCQRRYLPREEILGRSSVEVKEKYCRFLVDANNEPHIKTCPRCSHVRVLTLDMVRNPRVKKKGLLVICAECELKWCFPCQAPWHEGMTCKEQRKGDKLLKQWAGEKNMGQVNAQKCPKCKVYIQRTTGCEHMTCSKCYSSFCYRCGERYRQLKWIGDHYNRYSIFGCKYIYKPDNAFHRRLVRGSIFGGKIVLASILGVLAVGAGVVVLSGALIFYLPCYGVRRVVKRRRQLRALRAAAEERRRWQQKLEEINAAGDPYLAQYIRLKALGVNPNHLAAASQGQQQQRSPDYISEERFMEERSRIVSQIRGALI